MQISVSECVIVAVSVVFFIVSLALLFRNSRVGDLRTRFELEKQRAERAEERAGKAEETTAHYLREREETNSKMARLEAENDHIRHQLESQKVELNDAEQIREQMRQEATGKIRELMTTIEQVRESNISLKAVYEAACLRFEECQKQAEKNETLYTQEKRRSDDLQQKNVSLQAVNKMMEERWENHRKEVENLHERNKIEFQQLANAVLEEKTQKFTELNGVKLAEILTPLGKQLAEFKTQVSDAYQKENRERFSLGEQVKELIKLNEGLREEAKNLTRALKGESKTQGCWGEMILESILERSGLTKGREYFIEEQLTDEWGNPLLSQKNDKKMRPDAVVCYPDDRKVIIDSKVSLTAFMRMTEAREDEERLQAARDHVSSVRKHIDELAAKGYDDDRKSLDFVMMFVPNEAAYNAALQYDSHLWQYAYEKRILLMSPTNLIVALKLLVDLWKRELQSRNAVAIAEKGGALYDKFCTFIDSMQKIGFELNQANLAWETACKQLHTGNGNLVRRAQDLKDLGVKTKKALPEGWVNASEESVAIGLKGNGD